MVPSWPAMLPLGHIQVGGGTSDSPWTAKSSTVSNPQEENEGWYSCEAVGSYQDMVGSTGCSSCPEFSPAWCQVNGRLL